MYCASDGRRQCASLLLGVLGRSFGILPAVAVLGVPASCPHHAPGAPFPAALILRAGLAMFLRGLEGLPRVSAPQMSGGLFGSDSEDDDFTVAQPKPAVAKATSGGLSLVTTQGFLALTPVVLI